MSGETFYGKYRGTVVDNVDPLKLGRVRVVVPGVATGRAGSWALPCVPVAGTQMGAYLLPALGAAVWVEFEQGDPDHPIWVGGYWATAADVPALVQAGAGIVLQTAGGNAVAVSDAPGPAGGIRLRSTGGATIVVNDTGIYIQNGKGASLVLTGPSVTVNNGALVVT